MDAQATMPTLTLDHIFHPSDFTPASEIAFGHALKLALIARAELSIMHVAPDVDDIHWSDFPGVRSTLARWGILPEGSSQDEVLKLGLNVEKILSTRAAPVDSILGYLADSPADLVVLATHQRDGLARWLHKAVAEPIARRSKTMTLFVPQGVEGFVALNNGAVTLRRILIPIDQVPCPQAAVEAAAGLAFALGCSEVAFTLVHIGAVEEMPEVYEPHQQGWTWDRVIRQGGVVEQILEIGTACSADLIVLTTQGHDSLLDTLWGSHAERILRGAQCPVLAMLARAE
jgi:nucleotide-binding universal stress UspA family protein